MKTGTVKFLILFAYVSMVAWVIGAGIYICNAMFTQHATLAELRAIRAASEGWQQQADSAVERGRPGLLFVLQEIQQDPGRSRDFRIGRALEKAAGRFHPGLEELEKTAVRKIIGIARVAITDYLDGLDTNLSPAEIEFVELAARVFELYHKDDLCPHLDASKVSSLFKKIAAGEEVSEEDATYLRNNFKEMAARIDRFIAGDTFELYPEERKLFARTAAYCTEYAIKEGELAELRGVVSALTKLMGELAGEMTTGEHAAVKALLEIPEYGQALPAEKMKARLDKKAGELTADEKEQFIAASQKLSAQYERIRDDRVYEHRWRQDAVNGLGKMAGTFVAELTASEKSALKTMLNDLQPEEASPDREMKAWDYLENDESFPARQLGAWLDGNEAAFTQDEEQNLKKVAKKLSERYDDAENVLYNKPEYGYLRDAAVGLDKLAATLRAAPWLREKSALSGMLEGEYEQPLPTDKLKAWLDGSEIAFTEDENSQLLAAADDFLGRYEDGRVRLGETAIRFVENMRGAGTRFIIYEVYEDKEQREEAGVFELIFALWKKIDDKVMMVDMVEISGSKNEKLSKTMEEALVGVGEPAIATLIRSIRREKIDQALAAKTKDRTKEERLRELNESNKIVRLACMRALGRIGGSEAKEALKPFVDDEDSDIATGAAEALKRMP